MGNSDQSASQLESRRWFTSTHWSVVLAAKDLEAPKAAEALEKLCRTYWYPLYAYVRRKGRSPEDAQDITQDFFARLLQRQAFQMVIPGRGKFRSFLLVALNNFLKDQYHRQQAQKRGGRQQLISFDAEEAEQRYRLEPIDPETPEKSFERRWAITLLDGALARLEQEFVAAGKAPLFEQIREFIIEGPQGRPYAKVAAQLGMKEEAVKKAVQRLRRRYQEVIREEISHTVTTASEVEEELRYLCSVLAA